MSISYYPSLDLFIYISIYLYKHGGYIFSDIRFNLFSLYFLISRIIPLLFFLLL